jgi:hypothetical protein
VPLAAGAGRGHRRLHGRGGRQASRVLPEGGFLWADDFWGDDALEHLTGQFARILPPDEHSVHDLPANHPVFRTMFLITRLPQIPSIRIWGPYRVTSERGAETAEVHFRGISDQNGRLMVLMTHNTDIQDAWEREGESPDSSATSRPMATPWASTFCCIRCRIDVLDSRCLTGFWPSSIRTEISNRQ